MVKKVIIMGAGGRDFHNFLVYFKDNPEYMVVAFTATQIPGIEKRVFPKELAGKLYKNDIPIYPEDQLPNLVKKYDADIIHFAYSDLSHIDVMHKVSLANSLGCDFLFLGSRTMLKSRNKVIAVAAVRTGSGKSQTTRKIARFLIDNRIKTVVIRHPMPYGDLVKQEVQRFETFNDLVKQKCTIEEREEYEPLIEMGITVFAGVDYKKILIEAEKTVGKKGIIISDGGNNDIPFIKPDILITIADPLRPEHEITYYPGEINMRMADVIIINKENSAKKEDIEKVVKNARKINPKAKVIHADSVISVESPNLVMGKKAIVIEDGPTLTHGGMKFGAGIVAAKEFGAVPIDCMKTAIGSIKQALEKFSLKNLLPAMGYSDAQIKELEQTINNTKADIVLSGTPIDLSRIIKVNKPIVRVRYELKEKGGELKDVLKGFVKA